VSHKYYRFILALSLLSVLAAAIILLVTRHHGVGLSPDSVGYIATARNMANGLGAVTFDGKPLIYHPPLYPAILGAIYFIFGADPLASAHVVNAALMGVITFLSGLLFLEHLKPHTALIFVGITSVVVSIPITYVTLWAWTEPLFICFTLFTMIFSESYLKEGSLRFLIALSLCIALSCLTRYIGVILILTGAISIFLFRKDLLELKIKHLFIFLIISFLPIGAWMTRNYILSGYVLGYRGPSNYSLWENLFLTLKVITFWYLPNPNDIFNGPIISKAVEYQRVILTIFVAFIGLIALHITQRTKNLVKVILWENRFLLLYLSAYVLFLVISSTTTAYDQISSRLLSPVYVPLTILIFVFAAKILLPYMNQSFPLKGSHNFLILLIILLLTYPITKTTLLFSSAISDGLGFRSKAWVNNETISYLLRNKGVTPQHKIYTNSPYALYALANINAEPIPQKTPYNSPLKINDIHGLRGRWPEEEAALLVWFDDIGRDYLFSIEELSFVADLQLIARLRDGSIYTIKRRDHHDELRG